MGKQLNWSGVPTDGAPSWAESQGLYGTNTPYGPRHLITPVDVQQAKQNPGSTAVQTNNGAQPPWWQQQQMGVPAFGKHNMDPNNRGWQGWLFGGKDKAGTVYQGAAMPALQLLKGGMDTWMGLKQLGLAEDSLNFQKNAFSKQFTNQASLLNTQMADRQKARVDRNAGNNMAVDEYMNKNAVSLG